MTVFLSTGDDLVIEDGTMLRTLVGGNMVSFVVAPGQIGRGLCALPTTTVSR